MQQVDITIVGGGLVGASFAHAIAGAGFRVALIDKSSIEAVYKPVTDNRGLALSYTTKQALHHLGLWDALDAHAHEFQCIHVSEQGSFGFAKLTAQSQRLPALGFVIDAAKLGFTIMHQLESLPDIEVMRPENVLACDFCHDTNNWTLRLEKKQIQTKLLVAADGSNSFLCQLENIPVLAKNFDTCAIVANVEISTPELTTAYQRFADPGVVAMLPFGANQVKCVWTVPTLLSDKLMSESDVNFLKLLQKVMGHRLGKFKSLSARKKFAINSTSAQKIVARSCVLLGNAANSLHPVAAQGFNLGMRDAMTLATLLRQAKHQGYDLNSSFVLQQYAQARAPDHAATRSFTTNLVDIFTHESGIVKSLRRGFLPACSLLPPINAHIMNKGLGSWI